MLPEWYFCCCIERRPDQTLAYLSILETLSNHESDGKLLYLAYHELRQTEIWMQIFALPQVLESLHRDDLPQGIRSIVEFYFNDLVDLIPEDANLEEAGRPFNELINIILLDLIPSIDDINSTLQACAQATMRITDRNPTPTPYLDLKEYLPETLLLAVVADQLKHDRNLASKFSRFIENEEENSPLSQLLRNSLDYRFGRLAFRLAAVIAPLAFVEYSRDKSKILHLICNNPSSVIEFEPDLLYTYAEIRFFDPADQINLNQPKEVAKVIIEESLTFHHLQKHLINAFQRSSDSNAPLRLIGLEVITTPMKECLPLVYWQAILWDLASRIDVLKTAEMLSMYWLPPGDGESEINISYPYNRNEANEWKKFQLMPLMKLRSLNQNRVLRIETSKELFIPIQDSWVFFSPWLIRRTTKQLGRSMQNQDRYPEAGKPESLIRLIAGAVVSVRLLQKLPKNIDSYIEFASFIAHASDVLITVYEGWFKDYNKDKPKVGIATLTGPLTGLALFGNRQIDLAGWGRLNSISPDLFVSILRLNHSKDGLLKSRSKAELLFRERVLPEVLMYWISNAFLGAIDRNGPGRWLDLIPEVYEYQPNNQVFRKILNAASTTRFLQPSHPLKPDVQLDWRQAKGKDGNPKKWQVSHRQILLTERGLSADDWIKPEWNEPDWDSQEYKYYQSTRLVRAIERIASLKRSGDVSPEIAEEWRTEWKKCLNRIRNNEEADRFVRLRLLELLEDPVLKKAPEEQELVLLVLFEYGGAYEFKKIFEIIYPDKDEAEVFGFKEARRRVQTFLLKTMYRKLEQHSAVLTEEDNQQNVQDPQKMRKYFQRAELIQNTISRIAYFSRFTPDENDASQLGIYLMQLRKESYEKNFNQTTRTLKSDTVEIEGVKGKEKRILLPKGKSIQNWAIRAAVYDPNMLTTTLFFDDFVTDGIRNLFEESKREATVFFNTETKEPIYVLAVIVDVDQTGREYNYTFNCGFSFYLFYRLRERVFNPGDYVRLPIYKNNEKNRWMVSDHKKIRPLHRRLSPNPMSLVRIREDWDNQKRQRRLSLKIEQGRDFVDLNILQEDLILWDADVSRVFREFPKPPDRTVFARRNAKQELIPVDLDLTDLLLMGFLYGEGNIAILTLIQTLSGAFGETTWHFATQPGENYLLYDYQFFHDDAEKIHNVIQDLEDEEKNGSQGLLITVTAYLEGDNVCLRLLNLHHVSDEKIDTFYPNLKIPFDKRNIEWRTLFRGNEIAKRNGRKWEWYVSVDTNRVPGYKDRVFVRWDKYSPQHDSLLTEFTPFQWDEKNQRDAIVVGDTLYVNNVKPKDGNWQNFFKRWFYIKEGERIYLDEAKRILKNGFVPCLTTEKISVIVEAKSLTMKPLNLHRRPDIGENRIAEIFKVKWSRLSTAPQINHREIPTEAIVDNKCQGLLVEVPDGGTFCGVLWEVGDQVVCIKHQIDNLDQLRGSLGYKIIGFQNETEWEFQMERPFILARALWTVKEWDNALEDVCYLGLVNHDTRARALVEASPGELSLLPEIPKDARHLAIGNGSTFKNGLPYDLVTINKAEGNFWREGRYEYGNAILALPEGDLIGICPSNSPKQNLCISSVSLSLFKSLKGGDLFSLRREFKLQPSRVRANIEKVRHTREDDVKVLQQKLNKYFDYPVELDAIYQSGALTLHTLKVPTPSDNVKWTSLVQLAEKEGVFVLDAPYATYAKVQLFRIDGDGAVFASFRRVPPHTPNEFKRLSGANFNDIFPLEEKLFYVGPELSDPISGEAYNEVNHRFEWGYGKTLLVPESKLRYNNSLFSSAKFILFHGDSINSVRFLLSESRDTNIQDDNEGEITESCLIAIDSINIQWSQGRSLFSQRKDYKIVHILHVSKNGGDIQIDSVDGFDENRIQTKKRSFDRVRAKLASESQIRILSRLQKENQDTSKFEVLGRLDEQKFEESLGQNLLFEHVRLSFEKKSEAGLPLKDGELVFMQARGTIHLTNNIALQIGALDILNKEDIGADMLKGVLLLRRNFSVREDLLQRIHKSEEAYAILLVRLAKIAGKGVAASLISQTLPRKAQVPSRKSRALAGAITSIGEPLFATVVDQISGGGLQIELKPGVFVTLQGDQLEAPLHKLTSGSIIRIENQSGNKFRITQAIFGESRYVTEKPRFVVAFPKQDLVSENVWDKNVDEDFFWKNKSCFTIGGLPNILASPASYDSSKYHWFGPKAVDFTRLMETPHPKIVQLGYDHLSEFRVALASGSLPVGRLEYIEDSFNVKYIPLGRDVSNFGTLDLDWHLLSFDDKPAQVIIKRANKEKWCYHDSKTGTWSNKNQIKLKELGEHDVWTGPVIFQVEASHLRLRYKEGSFPHFGFPVGELIRALGKNRRTYPVAGVSDKGGLWIELTPGRIVELPAQIVVWQEGGREKSIAQLNWESFAPGDSVQLRVASSDPLAIDRIALTNWNPGPRKAFGPFYSFLPVQGYDASNGALRIGAGEFVLTIPMAQQTVFCKMVALNHDNVILDAEKLQPKSGDVVLLSLDEKEHLTVLGFPEFTPLPDQKNEEVWARDAFADDLLRKNKRGNYEFDYKKIQALIKAAGGALPFTVEYVSSQRSIFLSRRHQHHLSEIPPNKLCMARVLGLLNERGRTALLRCGGGIFKINIDQIISGLPTELFSFGMEFLKNSGQIIWLRRRENGEIMVGLNDERTLDISVEALDVISLDNEQMHETGLICRATDSMILYWLPATEVSWTRLSVDQLRQIFKSPDRKFIKVTRIINYRKTDYVSIVRARGVDKEFSNLKIGNELTVKVVIESEKIDEQGTLRYIVESFTSKAILTCETYEGDELPLGKLIPVEVVRLIIGVPCSVTVVPVGRKRFSLDLPLWIVNILSESIDHRVELENYLRWRINPPDIPLQDIIDKIQEFSDERVNELLCSAFKIRNGNQDTLRFQIQVVEEWARRNRVRPQINVAYAIMAILILYKNGKRKLSEFAHIQEVSSQDISKFTRDWQEKARDLTQELGRRALRSMHVEIISKDWLYNEDNRKRTDDLWPRLQQILRNIRVPLQKDNIGEIRHLNHAVGFRNMSSNKDFLRISDALAAATGELSRDSNLYPNVQVTKDLIDIYRTLPTSRSSMQVNLHESHIEKLRRTLSFIDAQKLEITLLDPLPELLTK